MTNNYVIENQVITATVKKFSHSTEFMIYQTNSDAAKYITPALYTYLSAYVFSDENHWTTKRLVMD